ncbi:MAG: hypothetical protein B2I17_01975 [Thermoplasmatales archaeon B_DKE]|nr:MAG: hypothetical protein B2I17_01975 [Thermoplasmatales archaeon B_DKE]
MNSNIWDLGYSVQVLNSIYFNATSINFLIQFSQQGLAFIVSPITFLYSIPAVLVFQSVMLGLPAYVLFEIAYHKTKNLYVSSGVAFAYLLYFPLAGINWFDFHLEALFIFLFLAGYLFMIKGYNKLAFLFLILSGFVRFPYMVLVIGAMFSLLLPCIIKIFKRKKFKISGEERIVLIILISSSLILAAQYLVSIEINPHLITLHLSSSYNPLSNLKDKLLAIALLDGPFLFLPLVSKKWIIPQLPLYVLTFFANNIAYEYPFIFSYWYTDMIIPFLFLGLIDSLMLFDGYNRDHTHSWRKSGIKKAIGKIPMSSKKVFTIILVLIVVCTIYLQPYGPLNSDSFNNFALSDNIIVNGTIYNTAKEVVKMIPESEPFVLAQNDFAMLFPRPAINNILVSPYNIGPNITNSDIARNNFPFNGGSAFGYVPINYVLVNLNNLHSLTEPPFVAGYPTMLSITQMLYASGYYGLVAASNGVYLLERNYSARPVLTGEFYQSIAPPSGGFASNLLVSKNTTILREDAIVAGPGTYTFATNITLNGTGKGALREYVSTSIGNYEINSPVIIDINADNKTETIYASFTFNNFYDSLSFIMSSETYSGLITVHSIALYQKSPL